ncbi:MAG: PhzF family phenazine biosynthesis protein [Acidimicrobiales bacterium]
MKVGHFAVLPRRLVQVDVFGESPLRGNPVAVVLDAGDLETEEMQRFARWTNLSETTFVSEATDPGADYRVRIFTTVMELPFAGHPTLGTCHAWLEHSSGVSESDVLVQQCGAGLVQIRRRPHGLSFSAPALVREGPVDQALVEHVCEGLNIDRAQVVDSQWVDNGPGWLGLLLSDADAVLSLRPGTLDRFVGVVGPYPEGSPCAFEVRAFFQSIGGTGEDPVTGSLNASLAQWLVATRRATLPYVVSQGSAVGASGRVHIETDAERRIWVGGNTVSAVVGSAYM